MSEDARPVDGPLRRARSMGDIPSNDVQRPNPIHIPRIRYSESHSGSTDRVAFSNNVPQDTNLLTVPSPIALEPQSAGPILGRMWSPPPAVARQMEEAQAQHQGVNTHHNRTPQTRHNMSLYSRTMAFFGYGRDASHARRSFVSLLWNLGLGLLQIVIIITFLTLGAHMESPTSPGMNEWEACRRPIGIWSCLWVIRVALACGLAYWGWVRDRTAHRNQSDSENSTPTNPQTNAAASPARHPPSPVASAATHRSPRGRHTSGDTPETPVLPHTQLYARLSLLSSLLTLSWFLTAHILEYTSINTCRLSSPHLWWLIFGILCIMYLMVLEVVLLGFVVFIIAPILFLFWNILLICIGRHPLQNPTMIKPEIGKLPKAVVDRIPLVMYIPPPPEEFVKSPVTVPKDAHFYPPNPPAQAAMPKRRFRFLRIIRKKTPADDKGTDSKDEKKGAKKGKSLKPEDGEPQSWEDHWEQGEYPFVRLEGNRAACAICLMDFEEPKRIAGANPTDIEKPEGRATTEKPEGEIIVSPSQGDVQEVPVENITEQEQEELKLADAGDGAQPLRLLTCGHVFHKTCLDPWLTDVSGRCPVCQRAVEVPEATKKTRNPRRHNHS